MITFTTPFTLTGILITDLFRETLGGVTYNEVGEFRINGGDVLSRRLQSGSPTEVPGRAS